MDNVLFLSDYEMYYKPIVPVETAEEQQKGEEEGEEGEEGAEEGEGEGADGEEGATQKQKKKRRTTENKQINTAIFSAFNYFSKNIFKNVQNLLEKL